MNADDQRWMGAALALAERGVGRTAPNPAVGCVIVRDDIVVGRGWTQPGGRPHGEAMALAQAGPLARRATVYTSLEPCAHVSHRGPSCTDSLIAAGVSRVVAAVIDPDSRTAGHGMARLAAAGIQVTSGICDAAARSVAAGFFSRIVLGRPRITLKLALSLDGQVAMASGQSKWITGAVARNHAHLLRARSDMILVGRGTWEADSPSLDVRLPGLEDRGPRVAVLSSSLKANGRAERLDSIAAICAVFGVNDLLVEGGAVVGASLLNADLVDRLIIYRAPILLSGGLNLGDIGLTDIAASHGRWRASENRQLGIDRLEIYERTR